jgi:hypothetical protein
LDRLAGCEEEKFWQVLEGARRSNQDVPHGQRLSRWRRIRWTGIWRRRFRNEPNFPGELLCSTCGCCKQDRHLGWHLPYLGRTHPFLHGASDIIPRGLREAPPFSSPAPSHFPLNRRQTSRSKSTPFDLHRGGKNHQATAAYRGEIPNAAAIAQCL